MDSTLLNDFIELEGLVDNFETLNIVDDDFDDDTSFQPVNARTLADKDVHSEMHARNIKLTGFMDTDREELQKSFNEEFKVAYEQNKLKRKEIKFREAQQANLAQRRILMMQSIQDEQDALVKDIQSSTLIDLIQRNAYSNSTLSMNIHSVAARVLAKALWENNTITCLNLSSVKLDDHAGMYLSRVLNRNKTIKKMELDNNFFSYKTCLGFADSLKINNVLVNLSLDSNPLFHTENFSECISSFKAFCECLKLNTALKSLNLWRTGLNSSCGVLLADAIEKNNNILFCDIGHNTIDARDTQRITNHLDKNLKNYEILEREKRRENQIQKEKNDILKLENDEKQRNIFVQNWLSERRGHRTEMRLKEQVSGLFYL